MIKTTDATIKLKELDYLGYTSLGILPAEILSEIIYETKDLIKKTKNKFPKKQLFNLINSDLETKIASNEIIKRLFNPYLETILDTKVIDIYPVSHIIKPFGFKSGIWHQDSAIVDERNDFSLNAWTSLVDSSKLNGCLWIFPGSHINTNHTRQFGFNPIEGKTLKKLKPHLIPIKAKAGEVIVFHRNLIHGSSRNWLPFNRVAIESVITSKNAPFYNFHREENMAKNKILGFQVKMEHFLKENPKEDFYNGNYNYIEFEDQGMKKISEYLINNIPVFKNHADSFKQK